MAEESQPTEYKPGPDAVDISSAQDGGVLKEIKREGTGEASPLSGDSVDVHYVGTLLNGEKFDSSRDRQDSFNFKLGQGQVIKGWDVGVATMKKGELSVFTLKPEYAYGERGSPPKIPPNSTLVFEVELLGWTGEDVTPDKDKGILKSCIKKGDGFDKPNDGSLCKIFMVGNIDGKVFDEKNVEFEIGEGIVKGIPSGIEMGVKKMVKGETSRFIIKPKYGFGSEGNSDLNVPGGATLQYDVTLESFEKAKEAWEMSDEEKLEQAEILKNKGTTYFKASNFKLAKSFYERAIDLVKAEDEDSEKSQPPEKSTIALAVYLNAAMCCLKLHENIEARDYCDKALKIDNKSEKALFRRGTAYMNIADYDLAKKDFNEVLTVSPENKAARNQIALANQKLKAIKEKEKKTFAGMFDKFAEIDSKKGEECYSNSNDVFKKMDDWDNKMADGYISLEQEAAAFGEKPPKPQYNKVNPDPVEDSD